MKELSLKEIQEHSLKVLLHVHEFCLSHDIQYSIAYGTLIGAVRHKGFIPWDDDVDIIMTRENFERFLKEYQSGGNYKLVSPNDKNSFLAFARVCDIKETIVVSDIPWSKYDTGIWVDIFPMDSVDDDIEKHRLRFNRIQSEWLRLLYARNKMRSLSSSRNLMYLFKFIAKRILVLNGHVLSKRLQRYLNEITDKSYLTSSHCAQLACCDEFGFYEKKDFEEYTMIEFERHQLMVNKEYDKMLRLLYGDYMQLPPVEDRIPKQLSIGYKFYQR